MMFIYKVTSKISFFQCLLYLSQARQIWQSQRSSSRITGQLPLIFPYFRRATKLVNLVAHKSQDSKTLMMSDAAGDYRRPQSTQRWRVWPLTGFDRPVAASIRS